MKKIGLLLAKGTVIILAFIFITISALSDTILFSLGELSSKIKKMGNEQRTKSIKKIDI